MPSWTDPRAWARALADTGHLIAFRAHTVRRRSAALFGAVAVIAVTLLMALGPRWLDLASTLADAGVLSAIEANLGGAYAGFALLAVASAIGNGGGRELLARSESAIHPIGGLTEHLGALALAPLNLAWMVQVWALLALTAILAPPGRLLGAQVVVLAWVIAATAIGQGVGWAVEGVRRGERGVLVVRVGAGLVVLTLVALHLAGALGPLARGLPTDWVAQTAQTDRWGVAAFALLLVAVVAVILGAQPAIWALGRPPREELRVASGVHPARPAPGWGSPERAMLRRLDRGSVWRSVGMRRGMVVLGFGPGLVGVLAGLDWASVLVLPGLTASGAALLFAVNAWCLDGPGMLWRETLPVSAADVFDVRARVIAECMLVVTAVPLLLVLLRTGLPSPVTGIAVVMCCLVVVVQVLATAMTWSIRTPYAVDLSSPRATPAPHAVMAGYAARLSATTTLTAMLFAGVAVLPLVWLAPLVAMPFLAWSTVRLRRARRRWLLPPERARVVLAVARA